MLGPPLWSRSLWSRCCGLDPGEGGGKQELGFLKGKGCSHPVLPMSSPSLYFPKQLLFATHHSNVSIACNPNWDLGQDHLDEAFHFLRLVLSWHYGHSAIRKYGIWSFFSEQAIIQNWTVKVKALIKRMKETKPRGVTVGNLMGEPKGKSWLSQGPRQGGKLLLKSNIVTFSQYISMKKKITPSFK